MRDRGDLEERVQLARMHVPVRFSERALFLELLRVDVSLEDDLCLGRDLEGHGLAAHETDRLPGEATRDRELVDAVRHLLHRRIGDDLATPAYERGGKALALAARLLTADVHVRAQAARED